MPTTFRKNVSYRETLLNILRHCLLRAAYTAPRRVIHMYARARANSSPIRDHVPTTVLQSCVDHCLDDQRSIRRPGLFPRILPSRGHRIPNFITIPWPYGSPDRSIAGTEKFVRLEISLRRSPFFLSAATELPERTYRGSLRFSRFCPRGRFISLREK